MSSPAASSPDVFLSGLPGMLSRWGAAAATVSDVTGDSLLAVDPVRSVVVTGIDAKTAAKAVDAATRAGMRVIHNERDEARLHGPDCELVIEAPVTVMAMCQVAAAATLDAGVTGDALQAAVERALNVWVSGGPVGDHRTPACEQDPALHEVLSVLLADRLREFRGWSATDTVSTFQTRPALVAASYSPEVLRTARALSGHAALRIAARPGSAARPTEGLRRSSL